MYVQLCVAIATFSLGVGVAFGFFDDIWLIGGVIGFALMGSAAFWYFAAIRWVDRHDGWS
jgi:hypothetical protein